MSYPINVNIPNAPNDPADDQPLMEQNFANISNYLNVDHVLAGQTGNGFHEQVTYFSENVPISLPVDPTAIAFTANAQTIVGVMTAQQATGSASPVAQDFFANANGVFPLNAIRAFGTFLTVGVTGAVTVVNGFNIVSVTYSSVTKMYTINLTVGATNSTTFIPIVTSGSFLEFFSAAATANTLTLTPKSGAFLGLSVNFVILQG
jgi:hypothetical protein